MNFSCVFVNVIVSLCAYHPVALRLQSHGYVHNLQSTRILPPADAVVLTVNENQAYLDCVPLVCKYWSFLGIDPHVFLISRSSPQPTTPGFEKCIVHHLKVPAEWSTTTVAQVSRLLFPSILTQYQNVMISDVDSIPIAGPYWNTSGGVANEKFVNMRHKDGRTPFMGYNSASPSTWKRIFGPSGNESVIDTLKNWNNRLYWKNDDWGADQNILKHFLEEHKQDVVHKNPEVYCAKLDSQGRLYEEQLWSSGHKLRLISEIVSGRHIWLQSTENHHEGTWKSMEANAIKLLSRMKDHQRENDFFIMHKQDYVYVQQTKKEIITHQQFFGQTDEAGSLHPQYLAFDFKKIDHGRFRTVIGILIVALLLSGLIGSVVNVGALLLVFKITAFFLCGASLIFLNKEIVTNLNFPFPFTLSGLGLLMTAAVSRFAVDILGIGSVRSDVLHAVSGKNWLGKVLPIAASKAMTIAMGNYTYIFLGVGYIQMMKTLTPVLILAMMLLCGIPIPSTRVILSVCVIVAGMMMEVQIGGSVTLIGLIIVFVSEASEALSLVLTQKLFKHERFSVVESLYVLALPGGILLYLVAAVLEWPRIYKNGNYEAVFAYPLHFAAAAFLGLAVNFTSMMVLEATSSLILKLLVTARSLVLILLAGFVYQEVFAPTQILGYAISLAGLLGYTWVQTAENRMSKEQDTNDAEK